MPDRLEAEMESAFKNATRIATAFPMAMGAFEKQAIGGKTVFREIMDDPDSSCGLVGRFVQGGTSSGLVFHP